MNASVMLDAYNVNIRELGWQIEQKKNELEDYMLRKDKCELEQKFIKANIEALTKYITALEENQEVIEKEKDESLT